MKRLYYVKATGAWTLLLTEGEGSVRSIANAIFTKHGRLRYSGQAMRFDISEYPVRQLILEFK